MPELHPRRPRFERAPVPRMVLTPADLELLRAVYHHRLLRSTHLTALAGRSRQGTLRRLQLLFHHGYLDRPLSQLDWYRRGSVPLVYALGQRGARELAQRRELVPGSRRWDTRNSRLSRLFLRHTLAVSDAMVAFEVACRTREGVDFISPEEVLALAPPETQRLRLPFRWQVDVREAGKLDRLGVEPDQVFGLRFAGAPAGRQTAFFFLEADRGTMPVVRRNLAASSFRRKLLAYAATWRQGVHRRHLGIPNFRVLTVTPTRERMEHLVEACGSLGGGLFLFADQASPGSGDILGHLWLSGRNTFERLLPK